jgi:hypothetical protein
MCTVYQKPCATTIATASHLQLTTTMSHPHDNRHHLTTGTNNQGKGHLHEVAHEAAVGWRCWHLHLLQHARGRQGITPPLQAHAPYTPRSTETRSYHKGTVKTRS